MSNLVRLLALSPFDYQYGGRRRYFLAGDYHYLDPNDDGDIQELKYILSPHFEDQEGFYIEPNAVVDGIRKEQTKNFYLNPIEEPPLTTYTPPINKGYLSDPEAPIVEPEENPFVQPVWNETANNPLPSELDKVDADVEGMYTGVTPDTFKAPDTDLPAAPAASLLEQVDPLEDAPTTETSAEELRTLRTEALQESGWKDVKAVAEALGLEYVSKAKTIPLIVEKEFEPPF